MKHLIIMLGVLSFVAGFSYVMVAYKFIRYLKGLWLRLFLAVVLINSGVVAWIQFMEVVQWMQMPLLGKVLMRLIAAIAGVGLFLTCSGWLKNGTTKTKTLDRTIPK